MEKKEPRLRPDPAIQPEPVSRSLDRAPLAWCRAVSGLHEFRKTDYKTRRERRQRKGEAERKKRSGRDKERNGEPPREIVRDNDTHAVATRCFEQPLPILLEGEPTTRTT